MKWEYYTTIESADIYNTAPAGYIEKHWPDHKPKRLDPSNLIPRLNEWGQEGWELVHMQPIWSQTVRGALVVTSDWEVGAKLYFCVFKRPIE